jgi:hypothetical protein
VFRVRVLVVLILVERDGWVVVTDRSYLGRVVWLCFGWSASDPGSSGGPASLV